jgi:hypothetical protein
VPEVAIVASEVIGAGHVNELWHVTVCSFFGVLSIYCYSHNSKWLGTIVRGLVRLIPWSYVGDWRENRLNMGCR